MKEKERDILAERSDLKKMPYILPEGYFDEFKKNMRLPEAHSPMKKAMPFVSIAASAALLIAGGLMLSQLAALDDDFTQEDFLVFSNSMINPEYYEYSSEQYADAEIANDDIIDYLIYSGITAEEIEHHKQ